MTSTVWLEMMWTDRRLVWDPQEFGGMDTIRINAKNVRKMFEKCASVSYNFLCFLALDPRYYYL